jgi:hypothetical protein
LPGGGAALQLIDWHVAMSRQTDWLRHERDMVRAIVGRRGSVPGAVAGA